MVDPVQQFAAFLQSLGTLPPSVNRFDATADFLAKQASVLDRPEWTSAKVSCYISWVLWFLVIVLSVEILIARRAWKTVSWLSIDRGLIRLNAGNWMAALAIIYGAVTLVEVTLELTIPADPIGHSSAEWYAWESAQFVPLYLIGVAYFMSIAGSCLLVSDTAPSASRKGGSSQPFLRRHSWRALAWFVNISGLLMTLAAISVIPTLVTISHHYAVPFRDSANKAIAQLRNAAPSYNPATFNVGQLLVLVAPVSATANDGVEALVYLRRTWIAWLSLIAFLSAVFTPFSSYHLFTLRRVAKTRADMTSKSHVRTTQSRWPAVLVRRAERLNPYYVVLVQTLAYHVIILIHLALCIWLVVLTGEDAPLQVVPVVGRYIGQLPFALVYILATLFNRYQIAIRKSQIAATNFSQAHPVGSVRVTQIVTQQLDSPVEPSTPRMAESGRTSRGQRTPGAGSYATPGRMSPANDAPFQSATDLFDLESSLMRAKALRGKDGEKGEEDEDEKAGGGASTCSSPSR